MKHYRANRDAQHERMNKRYAKLRRLPWLTAIQLAEIQEFYDIAVARTTQTGVVHNVDHIHPLEGENFQGLHVPWNLQVLTVQENVLKGSILPSPDQHLAYSGV